VFLLESDPLPLLIFKKGGEKSKTHSWQSGRLHRTHNAAPKGHRWFKPNWMHLYLFLGNAHNILHSVLSIFNVGNMLKCVTSKNLFFFVAFGLF
jgi:hypothetical protein